MKKLESMILQLEEDFFNAGICNDRSIIEDRICRDFFEYGKSGAVHTREDVIHSLINMKENRNVKIYDFKIDLLKEDTVIAHYKSYETDLNQYALRTSIWRKEDLKWKMLFHQGTPCGGR